MTMTAGITDPTELQAAQMRAEALLADKQALARRHATGAKHYQNLRVY